MIDRVKITDLVGKTIKDIVVKTNIYTCDNDSIEFIIDGDFNIVLDNPRLNNTYCDVYCIEKIKGDIKRLIGNKVTSVKLTITPYKLFSWLNYEIATENYFVNFIWYASSVWKCINEELVTLDSAKLECDVTTKYMKVLK